MSTVRAGLVATRRQNAPLGLAVVASVTVLLASGCGRARQNTCAELNRYAPRGVTLGSDEAQCAELLSFADTVQQRYGVDFQSWLSTVASQRVTMTSEAVFALAGLRSWSPRSFGPVPTDVPCGRGVPLTDDLWSHSPLSQILTTRPEQLYVSLAVEIPPSPGNVATVHVYQDFNCDHVLGGIELVGEFHPGLPLMAGGWKLASSKVSRLDE